jgi:hypothetical protein
MTLAQDLKPGPHESVAGLARDRAHAPATPVFLLVTLSVPPRPRPVPQRLLRVSVGL